MTTDRHIEAVADALEVAVEALEFYSYQEQGLIAQQALATIKRITKSGLPRNEVGGGDDKIG